jgi:competence protein ComEA
MNRAVWVGLFCASVMLASSSANAANGSAPPRVSGVVNLNTATPEQLKMLPGVNQKAVDEIVAHRAKHPFARPEELVNVKGFSRKRYQRVKPFLSVHGDSSIRLAEKLVRKAVKVGQKKLKKP